MDGNVRVGVVGSSWWSDGFHLPNLASHPRATLTTICGRNRERAEEIAAKFAIPHVFTDYNAMISSGLLDALVVLTPDDLHYPIVMAGLNANLHVLCEKPMAMNAAEAKAMLDAAEAAGRKHMVNFTWHWLPEFRYFQQLLKQGYVGRPYYCHITYDSNYGNDGSYAWRFDRQHGVGILGDLGSHALDYARRYVGEIARVSAVLSTFIKRPGSDGQALDAANDAAQLAVEFVNGAHGSIHVSAVGQHDDMRVLVAGDAGTLELRTSFIVSTLRVWRAGTGDWETLEVPAELWGDIDGAQPFWDKTMELFRKQPVSCRQFIDAITEGTPIDATFYDGWKVQQVLDAAIASHEQGRWITIA